MNANTDDFTISRTIEVPFTNAIAKRCSNGERFAFWWDPDGAISGVFLEVRHNTWHQIDAEDVPDLKTAAARADRRRPA